MLRFFLLGAALCASLLAPSLFPDLFRPVDYALDDWRTRLVIEPKPETRIVIVDVDERSLAEQGAWPWSRATIARLLQTLMDEYGVTSIAVDMVFPEPREHDEELARQMQRPPVTGAIVFDLEQRNLSALRLSSNLAPPLRLPEDAPRMHGVPVVANHAAIQAQRAGHITPILDADGALRRVSPILCHESDCIPALALAAYAGLTEQPQLQLKPGHGWLAAPWELSISDSGATLVTVPVSGDGTLTVPYRHARLDWLSVSATDILNRQVDPALLKGVMVLLGGTALGMSDIVATPLSPVAAGLEPHAEILSALLDNDFPVVPRWAIALDALAMLPFAWLLAWALKRYDAPLHRAAVFPVWLLLSWGVTAILSLVLLRSANLLMPLTPLLLFPPLALLFTLLAEFYSVGNERAGIFSLLSAYLPRQVASRLASLGGGRAKVSATVDASRREITVLFADIHGFAGLSEGQPPEVIARFMQHVFTEMAEAVVAHQGTIDKFIGDAIMAFWNAPDDDPDHARHAMAAAHDILHRMPKLEAFCAELGLPPVHIGIGMETGEAFVGNFGSLHRRTYTALGDPIVLASRLEALTKAQGHAVLIGEKCAAALEYQRVRALGPVQIRGRVQPVTLYVPD